MAQTSYPKTMPIAFAGMKADATADTIDSYVNAEATAEIPFGVGVIKGTADNRAVLPGAAGDSAALVGVVVHSHSYHKPEQLGDTGIKPKNMMSVMSKGRIYVKVEEAVTKGDRAFMRIANGSNAAHTQKGAWRKSADVVATVATAIEILGARYYTSAAADGFAILEIDIAANRAAL